MANKGNAAEIKCVEEELRRKFHYKCKFRAITRLVISNVYWLEESVKVYEGVDDVKRRIEQAVRTKPKKKQLLCLADKALLNKLAEDRSDREKKYIYRIIGSLKCFKRYPDYVKRKLAAVTYYKYYGPGRVIVREKHPAQALYFIVTGEVSVSRSVYDDLDAQWVSEEIGVMQPGDMFGEISLLHNIPRTKTITTKDHCEFLQLKKGDFRSVIQTTVQSQWDEVQNALLNFSYFDKIDKMVLREGCILSKIVEYKVDDIIVGHGQGEGTTAFFLLSGRCQLIESLQVQVTTRNGREFYKLYDPSEPITEQSSGHYINEKYFSNYAQQSMAVSTSRKSILKDSKMPSFSRQSVHVDDADGSRVSLDTFERGQQLSTRFSLKSEVISTTEVIPCLRTYFMQVCQMTAGASFGLGESLRDRHMVALTPVKCIQIPKVWLQQCNSANIWSRILHFLNKTLPTKRELFQKFVLLRRWNREIEKTISSVGGHSSANRTTISDVPQSLRMEGIIDKYQILF